MILYECTFIIFLNSIKFLKYGIIRMYVYHIFKNFYQWYLTFELWYYTNVSLPYFRNGLWFKNFTIGIKFLNNGIIRMYAYHFQELTVLYDEIGRTIQDQKLFLFNLLMMFCYAQVKGECNYIRAKSRLFNFYEFCRFIISRRKVENFGKILNFLSAARV